MGFQGDAVKVVPAALHHQAEQQHQHQQGRAAHGNHGAHRAVYQGARGQDTDLPAGLLHGLGLGQPGVVIQVQWLRFAGRVGLVGYDCRAFCFAEFAGRAKTPLRA
ncbi:hypothetical protein D3C76_1298550 [compost metagenome]